MSEQPIPPRKRYRSKLGQRVDPALPILGLHDLILTDFEFDFHSHPRGQLAYASAGVIKVYTDNGSWIVPPSQAVWIPGGLRHSVNPEVTSEIRHLFVDPSCLHRFPEQCSVVEVSPLLRELILRVANFGDDYASDSPASRIAAVILDELQALEPSRLHLPLSGERRLQRVMQGMIEHPDADTGLAQWSARVGASERTLRRLFIRETGMTFQQWRRQLLLHEAVGRLGRGDSVMRVALDLGYSSPSAFVAMFRKALGKAPGQYFKASQ
ncbi:AraC family transcriptional regulator [Marinobacterium sediminicola]|uniref:AraC-type DNA-binding protein n=1 Tax=Marinobacterium sediminicola TaxID=518898 RepID=A0ABY1S234_9GAMM|nr:helix-turn-helix transcriptional regulator [Marinobacterium sediminicola]ULG69491.1 helix-turn-helix transcriptional regulator [Marinobacterium sediminicola]SMR75641.1 AraC-type DNA-binding protein [Marinobacterium sediminicola]